MRRRIQRAVDVIVLGIMAERALSKSTDVYLQREGRGVWLRVDDSWPLTPSQARLMHRVRGLES